ncbi:MAG TPA: S41 family peptidase [Candidatus Acidoferrum sp.]|nr:S41 family peptidase [Candidatus Acidoferrum sp.]
MFHALILAVAALTPAQVDSVVAGAEKAFSSYIFPDVAAKAVARLKEKAPAYRTITDPDVLAKTMTADLFAVTHDKHVHIEYPFDPSQFGDASQANAAQMHQFDQLINSGFLTVRRLRGNIGYIDFREFSDDAEVGHVIDAAMTFVSHTDALIIDLRKNSGGSPRAAQTLEAYFFAAPQQITSLMLRDPKTGVVTETQQYTDATVPGPLYLNKPIYLLTSSHTFSCAEQFTYDLHNLKRVTIVGETTGGGANPGGIVSLGDSFAIFMPTGRAYSPITKTNWEGTGIAPDVATSAVDALTRAYVMALTAEQPKAKNAELVDEIRRGLANPADALAP